MKKLIARFDTQEDKAEFENELLISNIKSATKLLYYIIAFEILMIVRTFFTHSQPFPEYITYYLFCYSALFIVSIITLVGIVVAIHSKNDHFCFLKIITTFYEFCILVWSIAITTLDSFETERYIVYLTIVVCMTSILKQRPWLIFSLEIGGFFLLNLSLFIYLDRINPSQIINLTVFTTIFVVISISKYNALVYEYYNKKKINELNKMLESEKEHFEIEAKKDRLTGLYSRNVLKFDTEKRIVHNYQNGMATGVVMFDLDDFKMVNDKYGHAVGDECLRKLGDCFRKYPALTVYRYGGEEFLAICDKISEVELVTTIDCIVKAVSQFELSVDDLRITISAGYIYSVPDNDACDEKMINEADRALYQAKKNGKNCFVKGTL